MNWDYLYRLAFKGFFISYFVLWSLELNKKPQHFVSLFNSNFAFYHEAVLAEQNLLFLMTEQILIKYYSHLLIVVATTILFGWSLSKYLAIFCVIFNFLFLFQKQNYFFTGVEIMFLAVVLLVPFNEGKRATKEA